MTSKFLTASFLATALLAGLAASPAMAQFNSNNNTNTPGVDRAQLNISARIQQGINSGHITPSEAQALYARDRDIAAREAYFKSNGSATPQERQQLRAELDGLNSEVERMMANNDRAGRQPGGMQGIDNREYQISQRIDEGVRSGRITQREARRLHSRERQIAQHEASFQADGVVTKQERRTLRNELKALRDDVERAMRNDRRRG